MRSKQEWNPVTGQAVDGPIVLRRRNRETVAMDITPMIDIVFLLLIFFLVSAKIAQQSRTDLAKSKTGIGVNDKNATLITLEPSHGDRAAVYLGTSAEGLLLPEDVATQEAEILAAVEEGVFRGRGDVLIFGARNVRHGEISRISQIVGLVDGVRIHYAVADE